MGAIEQTTQQYAENTTIHGIGYIFGSSGISVLERLLWILIVCLGIFGAIFLSVTAYQNWQETPVLTTVATTGHPIEKVQFPAITICAQVVKNSHTFSQKNQQCAKLNNDFFACSFANILYIVFF